MARDYRETHVIAKVLRALIVTSVVLVSTRGAGAQSREWIPFVAAGGEDETYLRYLQNAGLVPEYPWSLRGFSPAESRRLAAAAGAHPWSGLAPFTSRRRVAALLPLAVTLRGNSAFPFGGNDGAVWAGRGITASAELGAVVSAGPLSLVVAPIAFRSQNAAFTLQSNGLGAPLQYADPRHPTEVDRPQRFGDAAYGRADPGQSTVRADFIGLAAGASTANMVWGPMSAYPFILSTNAPGFLHGFVGTAHPVNLWLAKLHGRVIWGRLEQSEYSPVTGSPTYVSVTEPGTRRFASGLVLVVNPRGVNGLELGLARFFHSLWPREGIPPSHFRKPFSGFTKKGQATTPGFPDLQGGGDNQLISVFTRWNLPKAGLEIYGEYSREDHSYDLRDLLQEPDHSRAYGLGLRKVITASSSRLDGFRIELMNFQLSTLARTARGEGGTYVHGVERQGHTNRGQLLGAPFAVGSGAASTIGWDRYTPAGRLTFELQRIVRGEQSSYYLTGVPDPEGSDVQYVFGTSALRRMALGQLYGSFGLIREFNRDFRNDVWAATTTLGFRAYLH